MCSNCIKTRGTNEDDKFKEGLVKFRTVADRRKRFTEEVHISLIDYIMNGSYYFGCELNLCPLFVPYGIVNQQPPAKLLDVFYFCDTTFLFFLLPTYYPLLLYYFGF